MVKPEIIIQDVDRTFSYLGVNKRREISRLIFEIAKRENLPYQDVLNDLLGEEPVPFSDLKQNLIKRRFPRTHKDNQKLNVTLKALDVQAENRVDLNKYDITPRRVFIEQSAQIGIAHV